MKVRIVYNFFMLKKGGTTNNLTKLFIYLSVGAFREPKFDSITKCPPGLKNLLKLSFSLCFFEGY